jgi:lambda family phage tail tape measure protein
MQDWVDTQSNLADRARQATVGMFDSMSGAVANFAVTGKMNFRSFTVDVLKDIAKIATEVAISKAVSAILSSFGGGSAGGTTPGGAYNNAAANLSFNALGGAYSSPSLSAFSGSVVSHPTLFAFAHGAGLMGEAGEEGIFPLRRGADGKLGVVAAMAGSGGGAFSPQYNIAIQNDGSNGQIGPQALKAVYDLGRRAAADFFQEQRRAGGALGGR